LVGLELRPNLLWGLRGPIIGSGGLQLVLTTIGIAAIAVAFRMPVQVGLAIGMIFSASSTAIVLQSLSERNLLTSKAGRTAFSVLLFQDIAVIPTLAILPLLPVSGSGVTTDHSGRQLQRALVILAVVLAIVAGGRFLVRPIFRYVASIRLHEIFTAASLLLVV